MRRTRRKTHLRLPQISFWGTVQWLLDRFVIGRHYWLRHPEELIIGFRVTQQDWEGKPTPSGWDNPKGPAYPIAEFTRIGDAKREEEKLRKWAEGRSDVCYNIEPIQIRVPELPMLVAWAKVRRWFGSLPSRAYAAQRRWRNNWRYRHERV